MSVYVGETECVFCVVSHYAFHDIIKRGNISPLKSFFISLALSVGLPHIVLFALPPLRRESNEGFLLAYLLL